MTETFALSSFRTGPFISGTTHTPLRLGQRPLLVHGGDDETKAGGVGTGGKKGSQKGQPAKRGRGATSLKDLVDSGILAPGRNKITVIYKGITYAASLQPDGLIAYQGKKFNSATAFSMHCKRQQTPHKQGDDGWKSVQYEGTQLDVFRKQYLQQASTEEAEEAPADGTEGTPEEGAVQANGVAATDQWVQCDRCRTWRVVPPELWPDVEADEREDWLCEYAAWDVSAYAPFKAACRK